MSGVICLVLDPTSVSVATRGRVLDVPWQPERPDAMVESVRASVGTASGVVVVVGLGLLEIAEPSLPPLSLEASRAVLWRDADRYFPLDEAVAVACDGRLAFALSSRRLASWIQAIEVLGPVRAIIAAPQVVAARADMRDRSNAVLTLPADTHERGEIRLHDGTLQSVRRQPLSTRPAIAGAPTDERATRLIASSDIATDGLRWIEAPPDVQLLDATLAARAVRGRQRRGVASGVLLVGALMLLGWAANRWRDAQLIALRTQATALESRATPALQATARVARARDELAVLATAAQRQQAPDAPLRVLAQLSRVLPRDVIVQRLEWDGDQWRVDGTADNAPRLVPLLDGDTHFRDVRIAAPSQRFRDIGRQRETFAIGFHMRASAGGANGAP